jgi:hypothetical protein
MDAKFCSICNINILKKNYSRHLKSPKHLENSQEPHVISGVIEFSKIDDS